MPFFNFPHIDLENDGRDDFFVQVDDILGIERESQVTDKKILDCRLGPLDSFAHANYNKLCIIHQIMTEYDMHFRMDFTKEQHRRNRLDYITKKRKSE